MIIRSAAPHLALALIFAGSIPVLAADPAIYLDESDYGAVTVWSSAGITFLEANEYVYVTAGSSDILSQLIWQSTAPILSAGFDVDMPEGWTFAGKAQFAISGDSYMEDYDWIVGPGFESYDFEDWTHRSQHELTNLDWYVNGSLILGYDLEFGEGTKLNLNGGFKYTDVQWTAYGGSYIYSELALHDDPGSWPDDEKGITYRQSFPALVAGADFETTVDALTFVAGVQGGFTLFGIGEDDHWMRNLNFVDTLGSAPLLGAHASVSCEIEGGTILFVEGSVEQIFNARGDGEMRLISTGAPAGSYLDAAGGDLFAANLSIGAKGVY